MTDDYGDKYAASIERMIHYIYGGFYLVGNLRVTSVHEQAMGHAYVYALADKHQIASLTAYTLQKLSRISHFAWTQDMVVDPVPFMYNLTAKAKCPLKKLACRAGQNHLMSLLPILLSTGCN